MLQRSFDEVSLTWRVPCLVIDGLVIVEVLHGDAALFRQLCSFIFRGSYEASFSSDGEEEGGCGLKADTITLVDIISSCGVGWRILGMDSLRSLRFSTHEEG